MNLRFVSPVWLLALYVVVTVLSCKPQPNKELLYDSPSHGSINISVDESFRPVIEEQIAMYQASYPGTVINAQYKTEAECFRDFFRDTSNRVIIVTRRLDEKEEKYMKDSLNYFPGFDLVATDAIAIVLHKDNPDTLLTLARLRDQLTGKINRDQKIVFDGLSATSNVRFVIDSILKGSSFDTSIVKATKTSKEVLEFVANDPKAMGFVGINWIGNPEVKEQVAMLKRVKLAYVECSVCDSTPFVKPVQESIVSRRYPLVRGLYFIKKENFYGLGTGFVNFLKNERGQLIFRRAYLGPILELGIRNVIINEKLPE